MQDRRLYLDTSDLIRIGDRQVTGDVIDGLLGACSDAGVVLLVSVWHLADLRAAPADAAQRVVAAVDRFPSLALIELDDAAAVVRSIDQLQEIVEAGAPLLSPLHAVVDFAGSLERQVDADIKSLPRNPVSERIQNLMSRLMHEVVALDPSEVEEHVRAFLHKYRRDVPPENAEFVVCGILGMLPMFQQLREAGVWDEHLVTAVLRPSAPLDPEAHVGRHLGLLVDRRRRAQHERAIQDGDVPDRHHVEFAPFVDIFMGDRDICAWLGEWRKVFAFERQVRVFGTGRLSEVTDAVRALGSG